MKNYVEDYSTSSFRLQLLTLALATSLFLPLPTLAATVELATSPLATSTTSTVKPNVMFILDDSGSMDWDYLPDWANDTDPVTGVDYDTYAPLHKNNGFNGVAYNPAISYLKPVLFNADGTLNTTTYPNMLSPWTAVKNDGYGVQSTATTNLVGNAQHYVFQFAEYCTSTKMTACVPSTAPITIAGIYYGTPAKLRWCNSAALTTCRSINDATYKYPRYPKPATATINVTNSNLGVIVSQITVNGQNIMAAATASNSTESTMATYIRDQINACTAAVTGICTVAGYSATASGTLITITAPAGTGAITYLPVRIGGVSVTITAFSGGVPGSNRYTNIVSTTANYPYPGSTTKAATRTDCAGTTCTYSEEMNNYANWWAYYHTRMQSMKTAVSRAFKNLDSNYRVGFSTISNTGATNGATFLGNNTFELAHKNSWYAKLFAGNPSISTPLRGALSKAGRYYGKKISGQVDPVQYSCQQNFAMLSTDGYWNTGDESSTYGPFGLTGASVGNLDPATTTVRPLREGTTTTSNTLADVAKYYYDTDLRTSTLGNCTGALGLDVCTDNVFISPADNNVKQHMTSFTMGLGADGTLNYTSDYETATSGDYYDLKKGLNSVNWPTPVASTSTAIDDLWHAAINGRGAYFSAKSPDEIIAGFSKTLSAITAKLGAAAAAATSTLNPVAGNNFAYVASYTTVAWKGNLESRTIDINTGVVSETATWCVENVVSSTCTLPNTVVTDTSGGNNVTYCVASGATLATCAAPSIFDSATSTCSTEISNACTGTLAGMVSPTYTRNIYTNVGTAAAPSLGSFSAANATLKATVTANISGLTQWASLTAAQQTLARDNLIDYLSGLNGYEDRVSNTNKLFRAREAIMGDALESQPAYTSIPAFSYPYPGYSSYISAQSTRAGTVYMGTNDGMLHAFEGSTGKERWAYIPSMVLPNLWQLADSSYATKHRNYVNGSPYISDICTANCTLASATWRTILVGGLNGGGRGYYALDITDVGSGGQPTLLWEFTPTQDTNLGYSFGQPVITRDATGKWVVLVTSGYDNGTLSPDLITNNSPTGDGKGYLYVLDAYSGAKLSTITTGVGSAVTPSGLAKISVWNNEPAGNTAGYVYGGDLLGNIWRFDINAGTAFQFATLSDGTNPQPITTTPVLGEILGKRVIFIGTGKYLEKADLTTTQIQTQYAISDNNATATLINPRSDTGMTPISLVTSAPNRTSTGAKPDFANGRGWYIDLPGQVLTGEGSERVNIDAQLVMGMLIVPTIVPSNTVCSPGGYGWLNFINYETGSTVGYKYDSTIVGINVLYIKGKPIVSIVTSSTPTPNQPPGQPTFYNVTGQFQGTRVLWRELIPQ